MRLKKPFDFFQCQRTPTENRRTHEGRPSFLRHRRDWTSPRTEPAATLREESTDYYRRGELGQRNQTSHRLRVRRPHPEQSAGRDQQGGSNRCQNRSETGPRRKPGSALEATKLGRSCDAQRRVPERGSREEFLPTLRQAWPLECQRPQYAFKMSMFNVSCNSH